MTNHSLRYILLLVLFIGFVILYAFYGTQWGNCYVAAHTGYLCPFCGAQGAAHHLVNLQISKAFHANALFVLLVPYVIVGLILAIFQKNKSLRGIREFWYGTKAILVAIIVVLAWWIARILFRF